MRVSNHKNLETENLKGSLNKGWVMIGIINKESWNLGIQKPGGSTQCGCRHSHTTGKIRIMKLNSVQLSNKNLESVHVFLKHQH